MLPTLLIIGGGFAGALAAKKLEKYFAVTLVDTKDYFEFTPSIPRSLVDPNYSKKIRVSHFDYLKKSRLITDKVTALSRYQAILSSGLKLSFDYALICSGSSYATSIKEAGLVRLQKAHELLSYSKQLSESKDILIVGGGPVGVELAAEIICAYPQKKVVLVHSKLSLLEKMHPKVGKAAHKFLSLKKVEIKYGQKLVSKSNNYYTTSKNEAIFADLVFNCTGITPNSDFVPVQLRDKQSFIEVNPFLQLQKWPNIFSAGDVNSSGFEKTAQNAENQSKLAIYNLKRLVKRRTLKKYTPHNLVYLLSLGPNRGILCYKNFSFGGWIPSKLRYFVEKKVLFKYRGL